MTRAPFNGPISTLAFPHSTIMMMKRALLARTMSDTRGDPMPDGSRQRIRLDSYTILIIALIPSFLLIAAGATWFYERAEARRACSDAAAYLDEVADLAASFQTVDTIADTGGWINDMNTLRPPAVASALHDAALSTVTYAMTTRPDLDVSAPGVLYREITPFQDSLDTGRSDLVAACPEVETRIPAAFPMFFGNDDQ